MNKIKLEICSKCEACDFFVVFRYRDYSGRVELQGKKKTEKGWKTVCRNWVADMTGIKSHSLNFSVSFKWLKKHNDVIVYDAELNKLKCPHYLEYLLMESDEKRSDDR